MEQQKRFRFETQRARFRKRKHRVCNSAAKKQLVRINSNKNMPCRETMPNRREPDFPNDELTRNTGNDEVNLPPPQCDRLSQPANNGAAPSL